MIGYFFHACITLRQDGRIQPAPTGFCSARRSAYFLASAYFTSWSCGILARISREWGAIHSIPKSGW